MTATLPTIPPLDEVYRYTKEQYLQIRDSGILGDENENLEFVEGLLLPKMSRKPPHDSTLDLLEDLIRQILPTGWRIRSQKAIDLDRGQPEPDIAVVLGPASRYATHHPTPSEIAFVIEITDTTLTRDRRLKLPGYARNGIAEYWIVNLVDRVVEVYTSPTTSPSGEPIYASKKEYRNGQTIPVFIREQEIGQIAVDAFLI